MGDDFILEEKPPKVTISEGMAIVTPDHAPAKLVMEPSVLVDFCESALVAVAVNLPDAEHLMPLLDKLT